MGKGHPLWWVRSDPWQAKCDSCFPKGQAWIQVFFEPCKQAFLLINLACFNSFLPSELLVPHTGNHTKSRIILILLLIIIIIPALSQWVQHLYSLIRGCPDLVLGNQCLGNSTKWCCVHTLSTWYMTVYIVTPFCPVRCHFEIWA